MHRLGILAGLFLLLVSGTMAQGVQGVHPYSRPLQLGVGFTFLSFHEVPSNTINNGGFAASVLYRRAQMGFEGELTDAVGSQNGVDSQILFTGGGARLYMPDFGSFRPWTHAEVGLAHLSPKSSLGASHALGYKVGGGFDFNPRGSRIEYRVSADILGSTFFGTYQVSPEVSVGFVLPLGGN